MSKSGNIYLTNSQLTELQNSLKRSLVSMEKYDGHEEQSDFDKLDNFDIKVIEKYLRVKKMKRINKL